MLVDLDAIPRREPGMAPFEVMISRVAGADVRGRPARAAGMTSARSASAGACRWRSSAASPTTATSRSSRAGSTAPAAAPGARELARIPASALTSDAIVHERIARAAGARRAAPAPGRPDRSQPTACPERGMDPGAVLSASSARPNSPSRRAVFRPVRLDGRQPTRSSDRVTVRLSCGSRARPRRSWPRPTGTRRSVRSTRGWAPR